MCIIQLKIKNYCVQQFFFIFMQFCFHKGLCAFIKCQDLFLAQIHAYIHTYICMCTLVCIIVLWHTLCLCVNLDNHYIVIILLLVLHHLLLLLMLLYLFVVSACIIRRCIYWCWCRNSNVRKRKMETFLVFFFFNFIRFYLIYL